MNSVTHPVRKMLGLCLLAAAPFSAFAQIINSSPNAVGLMVPAYTSPTASRAMWDQLIQLGNSNSTKLAVIVKPQSISSVAMADTAYVDANGRGPLVDLTNSSAQVFGYVGTDNATRDISAVQADIARYYQNSYWNGSSMRLDGIYLDGVSSSLDRAGYYPSLNATMRSFDQNATMIGNTSRNGSISNPSGQTQYQSVDLLNSFDVIVTYDGTNGAFASSYQTPAWADDAQSPQVATIMHSAATDADMRTSFNSARSSGTDWIYVTDAVNSTMAANAFDRLPSYWQSEIMLARATTNDAGRLITGSLSGAWFDPARSGEGFMIDIATVGNRNVFYTAWFTYMNGQPWWFTGSQEMAVGATSVTDVNLFSGSGTGFGTAFNSSQVRYTLAGNATFQFVGCNQLMVRYTINGETATRTLRRLVGNLTDVSCN